MFQIVTAFLISQRDSGYVESVRFPQRTLWCVSNLLVIGKFQRRRSLVFSVQMKVAHLNKQSMANGSTYFVQSGFLRRASRTKSLWSLSLGLSVFQNNGGSSYVWTCAFSHLSPHLASSQKCSVCDIREGACIQCSKNSCFLAYHVTCARKEKLLMPMKASSGLEPPPLQCFCERHMPVSHALSCRKRSLNNPQARTS